MGASLADAVAVGIGGGIGSVARWWIGATVGSLPWTTLGINVVGSLLLGLVVGSGLERLGPVPAVALGAGLCGGFTTYSTFSLEWARLAQTGQYGSAALYVLATLVACGLATWVGLLVGGTLR